jgi:hypothetical protein
MGSLESNAVQGIATLPGEPQPVTFGAVRGREAKVLENRGLFSSGGFHDPEGAAVLNDGLSIILNTSVLSHQGPVNGAVYR